MGKAIIPGGGGLSIKNAIRWKAKSADEDLRPTQFVSTDLDIDFFTDSKGLTAISPDMATLCCNDSVIARLLSGSGENYYLDLHDRKTLKKLSSTLVMTSLSGGLNYKVIKSDTDENVLYIVNTKKIIPVTINTDRTVTIGTEKSILLSVDNKIFGAVIRKGYLYVCHPLISYSKAEFYLSMYNLNTFKVVSEVLVSTASGSFNSERPSNSFCSIDFLSDNQVIMYLYNWTNNGLYLISISGTTMTSSQVLNNSDFLGTYGGIKVIGNGKVLASLGNYTSLIKISGNSASVIDSAYKTFSNEYRISSNCATFWAPTANSSKWALMFTTTSLRTNGDTDQRYIHKMLVDITSDKVTLEQYKTIYIADGYAFWQLSDYSIMDYQSRYLYLSNSGEFSVFPNGLSVPFTLEDNFCILSSTKGLYAYYASSEAHIGTFTISEDGSISFDNNEVTTKGSSKAYCLYRLSNTRAIALFYSYCCIIDISGNSIDITQTTSSNYYSKLWEVNESMFIAIRNNSSYLITGKINDAAKTITEKVISSDSKYTSYTRFIKLKDNKFFYSNSEYFGLATVSDDGSLTYEPYNTIAVSARDCMRLSDKKFAVRNYSNLLYVVTLSNDLESIEKVQEINNLSTNTSYYTPTVPKCRSNAIAPYIGIMQLSTNSGQPHNYKSLIQIYNLIGGNCTVSTKKASFLSDVDMQYIEKGRYILFDSGEICVVNAQLKVKDGAQAILTSKATKKSEGMLLIPGGVNKDDYTFD